MVFIISGLAFSFGFGNGLELGLSLGVPRWIAGLVSPAVDLSVLSLIVSIQHLRTEAISSRLIGARLLLVFCGIVTLTINVAKSLVEHQYGRAAFDAVAPLLLIFWGEVGPGLLRLLHAPVHESATDADDPPQAVRIVRDDERPAERTAHPSPELVRKACELNALRRKEVGRPISRDVLRKALGTSNALAGELVRIVRTTEDGADE